MGDWSTAEQIMFLLILVGIPMLICGIPFAISAVFTARRRSVTTVQSDDQHVPQPRRSLLFTLLTILCVGVCVFLVTTVGFST